MRALLTLSLAIVTFSVLGQDSSGASAARPGDENLTCDQLRTEMMAQRQQVDVRGVVEQQRAAALAIAASEAQNQAAESEQTEQRESDAADDPAEPAADGNRRGGGLLRGAAGAGGFGRGRGRGDNADEAPPAQEQPAAREPAAVEQSQAPSFGAGPPGMARGFRLMELAQAKKCAFLDEGAPPRAPR